MKNDLKGMEWKIKASFCLVSDYYKTWFFPSNIKVVMGFQTCWSLTSKAISQWDHILWHFQSPQVHSDILEEDTSTPEMDNQGTDMSLSTSQDQGPLPEEGDNASTSESGSSSNPDEEEEESTSSVTDSSSPSSEPVESSESAADSTSDESDASQSDSDEDGAGLDSPTDAPAVIAAK